MTILDCLIAAVILAALATASVLCFLRAADEHRRTK